MKPKISVVIALAPYRKIVVLESLEKVDYPRERYELIVKEGLNPSENRNNGVLEANGDIIAFIDDDAIVDKDILRNAEKFFDEHLDHSIVGGPQLTPKEDKFFARTSGYVISSFLGSHVMSKRYKKLPLNLDANETSLTSANLFVKKEVFSKIEGFDTTLFPGEDPELFARMKKAGFKIAYSPDLIIYHKRRPDFKSFCKQSFLYGKVRVRKELKHGLNLNSLIYVFPILFLLYLVFLPILYLIDALLIIPLYVYLFFVFLSSFYLMLGNKDFLSFFLMPILYLSWHLSYGFGMLVGFFGKV